MQNYTHKLSFYAELKGDGDRQISIIVDKINAVCDRFFPKHSLIYIEALTEHAKKATRRDDVYYEPIEHVGNDDAFAFTFAIDYNDGGTLFKLFDFTASLYSFAAEYQKGQFPTVLITKIENNKQTLRGFFALDILYRYKILGSEILRSDQYLQIRRFVRNFGFETSPAKIKKELQRWLERRSRRVNAQREMK